MSGDGEPWWTPGDEGEPWFANFPLGSWEYSPVVSKGTHSNKNEGDEEDDEADKDFAGGKKGGGGGGVTVTPDIFGGGLGGKVTIPGVPGTFTVTVNPPGSGLPGTNLDNLPGVNKTNPPGEGGKVGWGFNFSKAGESEGNGWSVTRQRGPRSQMSMMKDAVKKNNY